MTDFVPRAILVFYRDGQSDWYSGGGVSMIEQIKAATTLDHISAIIHLNQEALFECAEHGPKSYFSIDGALEKRRQQIREGS